MADGYEVVKDGNGRVLVILHPAVAISRERILELLMQAGIDAASVVFIEPAEAIDVARLECRVGGAQDLRRCGHRIRANS